MTADGHESPERTAEVYGGLLPAADRSAEKDAVPCHDTAWFRHAGRCFCDRTQGHSGEHYDRGQGRSWPNLTSVIPPEASDR